MATLLAYLDASGSVADPGCRIFTIAGYVASADQWHAFEKAWQKALEDEDVTHLHMRHFAHSRGEFSGWKGDEARRARFLEGLTKIIRDHELEDFSTSLNMEHYRAFDQIFKLTESLGAYAMIAAALMGRIERTARRRRDSVSFFLEKGDAQQRTLATLASRTGFPAERPPNFVQKQWLENGVERARTRRASRRFGLAIGGLSRANRLGATWTSDSFGHPALSSRYRDVERHCRLKAVGSWGGSNDTRTLGHPLPLFAFRSQLCVSDRSRA